MVTSKQENRGPRGGKPVALEKTLETLTSINVEPHLLGARKQQVWQRAGDEPDAGKHRPLQNNVGDEGAARLTAALEKNSEVTSIELGGNQIGDEGVMRLAVALEEDATLTSIDLEHNEIGTKGAVHRAPVLEKNATMTHIDLPTR